MTAISISKEIYNLLINDDILKGLVADKIYPLIAEEETTFPFIIFKKNSIQTEYTKDGRVFDEVNISITSIATDYFTTVNIIERVREIFENCRLFAMCRLSGVTEDYIDNAFIMEISFNIKIKQ